MGTDSQRRSEPRLTRNRWFAFRGQPPFRRRRDRLGLPPSLRAVMMLLILATAQSARATHLGSVTTLSSPITIGPDAANQMLTYNLVDSATPNTTFLIPHFQNALKGGDYLEIQLGYDTAKLSRNITGDGFTAVGSGDFWTRPIGTRPNAAGPVTAMIRYVDDGDGMGHVTLDSYGRGARIDPFLHPSSAPFEAHVPIERVGRAKIQPRWENVASLDSAPTPPPFSPSLDLIKETAKSVGMIIAPDNGNLSTCTATLIDSDLILTAAHCVNPEKVHSGSITFDYQTTADGGRPAGYDPVFYKLKSLTFSGYDKTGVPRQDWGSHDGKPGTLDYAIVQVDTGEGGLDLAPIEFKPGGGSISPFFIVHHPGSGPKKVSRHPIAGCDGILGLNDNGSAHSYSCDVNPGSSGSSHIDNRGRIVGVTSTSSQGVLSDALLRDLQTPRPEQQLQIDVMLAFDRSGSMRLDSGVGNTSKIQEARSAVSLFLNLIEANDGHRAGLVTYNQSATPDWQLRPLSSNNTTKNNIIQTINSRAATGLTSIGDALRVANNQLPSGAAASNTPSILLLTDGLHNTPPSIESAEANLGSTTVNVIGFGSEYSLDGARMTRLARDHFGVYTRAGDGLELKKFFALAFGQIFRTGASKDPYFAFGPRQRVPDRPFTFDVSPDETELTVALGWETLGGIKDFELVSPGNNRITATTPGVVSESSDTWSFLRLPLPFNGERAGQWEVLTTRGGDIEFPPNSEERFFISTIVEGGPFLRPFGPDERLYTGDPINPAVVLRQPDGSRVPAGVTVEVTRPLDGNGNILSRTGLLSNGFLSDGDQFDERMASLFIANTVGGMQISTRTDTFVLSDDGRHDDGAMEPDGVFGNPLLDISRHEGNYDFRAVAALPNGGSRETSWSVHVDVGIDAKTTLRDMTMIDLGRLPDGRRQTQITVTPRDRYGNHLGTGRLDAFDVAVDGSPNDARIGSIVDNKDGSYSLQIAWDPAGGPKPDLLVSQPDRSAVRAPTAAPRVCETRQAFTTDFFSTPATVIAGTSFDSTQFAFPPGPVLVPGHGVASNDGFLRLATQVGLQGNSVAFDASCDTFGPLVIAEFDLRVLDENGEGGQADGLSFLLIPTTTFDDTGPLPQFVGEEPNLVGAFGVGFDTFDNDEEGGRLPDNRANHVSLHWDGTQIGDVALLDPNEMDLVNGAWNHAVVMIRQADGGAMVTVSITDGTDNTIHVPFRDAFIPGLTFERARAAFTARTGLAADHHDLDNLLVQFLFGDFNGNGVLDVTDVDMLSEEVANNRNRNPFDVNFDGTVNQDDIRSWIRDLKHTWIGDADLNGEFDSSDLVTIFGAGKYELNEDAGWAEGDWTGDGRFDSSDLVAAFNDAGFELGPRVGVAVVPEPSCWRLLPMALIGLFGRRRFRGRL